ncbi:amidase family protein [Paraburkholderia caffeinilytica]|uniref:amidase family protein n=1 Tax=Paraburkholderia caffeinilytica TaxID=1761016 RepID=UPI0038BC9AAF
MKNVDERSTALMSLSATDAVAAMKRGDVSAEAYAAALLARASQQAALNAFVTLAPAQVMQAARDADLKRASGQALGVLHGLPVPVKDSVNTRAFRTTNGTRALRDFQPQADAELVRRLVDEGAIVMGKTNLTELSFGWTSNNETFGAVRNPYDLRRVPGGSSGGSAAAVAARIAPLAVAADTLGSIRVPASFCGLAGLRPTFGRYPNEGAFALTDQKLDQIGALARCVDDLALFDSTVTGDHTPLDTTTLAGARIGVCPFYESGLDPDVARVYHEALARLSDAGAVIVRADVPPLMTRAFEIAATIMLYEAASGFERLLAGNDIPLTFDEMFAQVGEGIGTLVRQVALPPNRPTHDTYVEMLKQRKGIESSIRGHFEQHGIVTMAFPATAALPPFIGQEGEVEINGEMISFFDAFGRNTALSAAGGIPGLVLPAGSSSAERLPVGIEFVALPGHDRALLSLGREIENVLKPATLLFR